MLLNVQEYDYLDHSDWPGFGRTKLKAILLASSLQSLRFPWEFALILFSGMIKSQTQTLGFDFKAQSSQMEGNSY